MRNTPYHHRLPFDLEDIDDMRRPERTRASNRSRRRIITITRMVRIRFEEFFSDDDGEEDDRRDRETVSARYAVV